MSGAELIQLLDTLADDLERRELVGLEETARAYSAACTCMVMGHYPEQVFPRVLKRGECNERLGNSAFAAECYLNIAKDFETLRIDARLLENVEEGDLLDDSDRALLECVAKALDGLRRLKPAEARLETMYKIRQQLAPPKT